jgi:hypothetical protein
MADLLHELQIERLARSWIEPKNQICTTAMVQ